MEDKERVEFLIPRLVLQLIKIKKKLHDKKNYENLAFFVLQSLYYIIG